MSLKLALLGLGALLTGCVWTSDGGVTALHVSTWEAHAEGAVWDGAPISVSAENGSINIVGEAGRTTIAVHATLEAGANSDADAEAAFHDVADRIAIAKTNGAWSVTCPHAGDTHGSAVPLATGCHAMTVLVPGGVPIDLRASASFGGIHASGVLVSALDLEAPFGLVADVQPTKGAHMRVWGDDLVSGHCSSYLRVPETTGLSAQLDVQNPNVHYAGVAQDDPDFALGVAIDGFTDAPALAPRTGSLAWKHGDAGGNVVVRASLGQAVLTTGFVPDFDPTNQCANIKIDG
jgi:hypothetical protein